MQKCLGILVFLVLVAGSSLAQPTRIVCIGGSITQGEKMANPEKNNYPAQLQQMLGKEFLVEKISERAFQSGNKVFKSSEGIFVIEPHLTNSVLHLSDSLQSNINQLQQLIELIRKRQPGSRIVVLGPPPRFSKDSSILSNKHLIEFVFPLLQQLAYRYNIEYVHIYTMFIDQQDLFPDQIHLSSNGSTVIARRVYELVKMKGPQNLDVFGKITQTKSISSFHGFAMADFTYNGRSCKIVKPKKVAVGIPWVWRARFWGHEPQTDIALLERGFHLVYCDVAELYGNQEAIVYWNKFYDFLLKKGFSDKASLEGMSRGGVYMYNWALANPSKIACIYADAPVLDFKSWPGGKGKGPGSSYDWELFKKDYQLNEEAASKYSNSPLNNASKIAHLNIPLLHVVGDADEVVPVEENTGPFEEAILKAGGQIRVIHKPGVKHHPHSLENPQPIVDFILRANKLKTNFATVSSPGAEYRSGAGWNEGTDWWFQHGEIDSLIKTTKDINVIFLGNSITQGIAGKRPSVTYRPGLKVFDSIFKGIHWISAGISGDRTQNLLWRLEHGSYCKSKPAVMVLSIGVNNFNEDDSPQEIVDGIVKIVEYIKLETPSTKIILSGPLPTGIEPGSERRKKYDEIQSLLSKLPAIGFMYFPLTKFFVQPNGELSLNDYSEDGIHLLEPGYRKWATALAPVIQNFLAK